MGTYSLKRQEEIKPPAGRSQPEVQGKRAGQSQPVRKMRLVTVAEGLSWAEAKRQRNLDGSLEIVPERAVMNQAPAAPGGAEAG